MLLDSKKTMVYHFGDTVKNVHHGQASINTDEVPFDIVMLKAEPDDFAHATGIYTIDV